MKLSFVTSLLVLAFCVIFSSCGKVNRTTTPVESKITAVPGSSTYTSTDSSKRYNEVANSSMVGASEQKQNLAKRISSLLMFHADDTMEVHKVYMATLGLAKNGDMEDLRMKVLESSDASSENVITDTTIQIGKSMKATLVDMSPRGDKSFDIQPQDPADQNISSKTGQAFWSWTVEPLKEGNHQLRLTVVVTMSEDETFGLPPKEIPVTIFATKASFLSKLGVFFSNYWQWVVTGIFVPVMLAWFTTWFRFKSEQRHKAQQAAVEKNGTQAAAIRKNKSQKATSQKK